MVVPVMWCCRNWPVLSGGSSRAAPPAAGARPIVPEASAKMTGFRSSGGCRRHGVVGRQARISAPRVAVAHGVLVAGLIWDLA